MPIRLNPKTRFVFIGDSITDCGRGGEPDGIGSGYVRIVRDYLRAKDPAHAPEVLNRGISGNKVTNLRDRWQRDVIELSPNVLSIMIGVNDVWHGLNPGGTGVDIGTYRSTYGELIAQAKEKHPQCAIILCEPTIISPPAHAKGNESLKPYVDAVRELAAAQKLALVPLHEVFLDAAKTRPDIDWTTDGVHPTSSGHMLIARQWLSATELL
ncbi:MAG TPA: SGNH/GDSL hydrolase family protein [Tepidisphaeraceae bacterium]|nr:SGNH/GDSL hydrolase family protein [Tepidisphaeraceae bacterium]